MKLRNDPRPEARIGLDLDYVRPEDGMSNGALEESSGKASDGNCVVPAQVRTGARF